MTSPYLQQTSKNIESLLTSEHTDPNDPRSGLKKNAIKNNNLEIEDDLVFHVPETKRDKLLKTRSLVREISVSVPLHDEEIADSLFEAPKKPSVVK